VDLNSDLGEGFGQWTLGDDDALLGVVTSANVACGFHASDATIMRRVCARAVESGVAIGAQVGYRDLPGFGRRFIDVEPEALTADVVYQIGALEAFARIAGDRVRYVKPHGALYNAIVHHEEQAAAVVAAVVAYDPALPVLGLPRGIRRPRLHAGGDAGLPPAARRGAARPGRDRPAVRRDGRRRADPGRRGRRADPAARVDLRARRHPRRGGDRPAGARGADDGGGRAGPLRRLMRLLPSGSTALLVELDGLDDVLGLYAALSDDPPEGVVDIVPAARTVLLVTDPARTTLAAVADAVRRTPTRPGGQAAGDTVELPVHYDGADLDDLARLLDLTAEEVVARHTGAEWTVAFCGFAPGFGYLTQPGAEWDVPRRATPRTKVPPGAVALAGEFSGVYPRESPGGWQLIGHTDVAVFDLARDPAALLRPGTRVRFVEVA
jgi:KipI family sensor histidine kinase inhibitor